MQVYSEVCAVMYVSQEFNVTS